MMKKTAIIIIITMMTACFAAAQWIETPRVRPQSDSYPLQITDSTIDMNIKGQFVRVEISQTFYNPTSGNVEGTYMFPIPLDVMISDFAMWVDGKRLEPRLLDAAEAQKIYESYVRRSKDPALLRYVDQKLLQVNIFPIPPRSSRKIQLSYRSQLNIFDRTYQAVVPLKMPDYCLVKAIANFRINVKIEQDSTIYNVYSPGYIFRTIADQPKYKEYAYESNNFIPHDNVFLYFTTGGSESQITVMTYKPGDEDGFFFLSLDPGRIPRDHKSIPRTIILVIDVSGSMESDNKLNQVREAAQFAIGRLEDQDMFNIITFAEQVESYAEELVPANKEHRQAAASFIRSLYSQGGTNINDALQTVLRQLRESDSNRSAYIIFMTDGLPTVGTTEPSQIMINLERHANPDVRMFVFGVGYDVNATFLQEIAQKFRGTADFVEPFENLEQRLSSFFSKILEPAIQNPVLSVNGNVKLYDIYPHPLPDVFYGNTLTITGRYRGKGTTDIEIKNGTGKGKENSYRTTFKWKDWDTSESFIAPLWASRKIGHLLRQIKINGEQAELVQAVKNLSLKYNILTPYTAFLVEEPQQQARRDQNLPKLRGIKRTDSPPTESAKPQPSAGVQDIHQGNFEKYEGAASGEQKISVTGYPAVDSSSVMAVRDAKEIEALAKTDNIEAKDAYSADTKRIGSKIFKLCQGKWIDTEYDSVKSKFKTIHVKFGSDEYFKLLASSKELAQYFAIAQQVIVVHARTIYFVD